MNPLIVWRLAKFYRSKGIGLLQSIKTAYQNHNASRALEKRSQRSGGVR